MASWKVFLYILGALDDTLALEAVFKTTYSPQIV